MKLQKISSTAVLIYIVINVIVTAYEGSKIDHDLHFYFIFRGLSLLLAIPCYFLFKKNALNSLPQILFASSLLIYNLAGYYFKPLYLPSFIQSIYALAFFVFMTRTLFIVISSTMTFVFVSFCMWAHPYLAYNPGDLSAFDIVSVPVITLVIALMIHHFFTAQRQIADLAHIKFGTLGRLSARAFHDVKGSLQNPFSLAEQIQLAADRKDFQNVKSLAQNLQDQFIAIRSYLFSLNQVSKFADLTQSHFRISDSVSDAVAILKGRLNNIRLETDGESTLHGSKILFTSIFINLITNSLDEFDLSNESGKTISIEILKNVIIYKDSIRVKNPNTVRQLLNHTFTTKSEGSGLGIYFIKEALEQFNGKLKITLNENNLVFKISLNTKYFT